MQSNFKRFSTATRCGFAGASGLAIALAMAPLAMAQETTSVEAEEDKDLVADVVIVTARRVAEDLQDTPVAVTAFSGGDLEAQGAAKITDVATLTPSFTVKDGQSTATAATFVIRGQVQTDILATLDPSVGTYVDGVYWARAYGINGDLLDVSSAQVLRGPQGTLFGRNTSAGAFLIETNKPDLNGSSARFTLAGGNEGQYGATVVGNGVVSDTFAIRAAVQVSGKDGWLTNLDGNQDLNNAYSSTARLRALWAPTENFNALVSLEHFNTDAENNARQLLAFSPGAATAIAGGRGGQTAGIAALNAAIASYTEDTTRLNETPRSEAETDTLSAKLTYDFGPAELQFIAAERSTSSSADVDLDGTGLAIHFTRGAQKLKQSSFELQLAGEALDDRLSYVLGGMLFEESGSDGSLSRVGFPSSAVTGTQNVFLGIIDNEASGYFGQFTFGLTDSLNLTAGYRYSDETKGIETRNGAVNLATGAFACSIPQANPANCAFRRSDGFDGDSYTIGLDYRLSDDVMIYAKQSTGFRSGAQNLRMGNALTSSPALPEESEEIEVGLRSEFWDNRVRFNLSAYKTEVTNLQRSTIVTIVPPTGPSFSATVLGNLQLQEVEGGELEASARLTDNFSLAATAALTQPKYVTYFDNSGDRSNERIQDVPESTYTLSAMFDQPTSLGDLSLRADYAWTDEFALQPQVETDPLRLAATTSPAGSIVNVRAALQINDNTELAVYGRNITDNRDLVQALTLPAPLSYISGIYRAPATYGVSLTVKLGEQ